VRSMHFSLRGFLLRVLLGGLIFGAASRSHAQVSWTPECTAKQLDLKLAPQTAFATASNGHRLSVELQNRESTPCLLPPLMAEFGDASSTATEFGGAQQIAGGDIVHVLFAWSSAPIDPNGIVMYDCATYDTLTMFRAFVPTTNPLLKIEHLAMHSCGSVWISSYRPGPYIPGEPIAQDWLDRFHLRLSDFPKENLPESVGLNAAAPPGIQLRALSDVEYLKATIVPGYSGYFELFLKVPLAAKVNCPFNILRKREADGQTIVYLNHCEDFLRNLTHTPGAKETRLLVRELGLLPERPGRVEYGVTSEVLQKGKPKLAYARIDLSIRDPQQPLLPEIDTRIAQCLSPQLALLSPPVQLGNNWVRPRAYAPKGEERQDGKVFEVTNVSAQNCMLGGVPELKFLNPPEVKSGGLLPEVCRDCANSLYRPRGNRWIELKPNDAAHFAVARTVFDSDYWFLCAVIGGLELSLPGDKQSLRLPFETGSCGPVRVSAWRAGQYDGDPMNVQYDRAEHERELRRVTSAISVPSGCTADVSMDTGRPVMFRSVGGLAWGLSTKPIPYGEAVPVILWVCNTTDAPKDIMTCSDIARFWRGGIDLFDSSGHRVLNQEEENQKKLRESGGAPVSIGSGMPCIDSAINILPHSSIHGSFSKSDYLSLRAPYSPPPGRYFIVPSERGPDYEPYRRTLSDSESGLLTVIEEE
jgi:hypothetical protein